MRLVPPPTGQNEMRTFGSAAPLEEDVRELLAEARRRTLSLSARVASSASRSRAARLESPDQRPIDNAPDALTELWQQPAASHR